MLLGLRSLWETGVTPAPPVAQGEEQHLVLGMSGVIQGGRPVYIAPRKKKTPWPGEEIEEEEVEEILAMIGIEI